MAFQAVENAPKAEDFTSLLHYNEQTPHSFEASTVLHQVARAAKLKVAKEVFDSQVDLRRLTGSETPTVTEGDVCIADVDIWVTNRYTIFYASKQDQGFRVLYPSITITAQDRNEVLLEFNLSLPDTADEDIDVVQMRVIPDTVDYPERQAEKDETNDNGVSGAYSNGIHGHEVAAALFKAISDCQELNPDPRLPGEDDEDMEGDDEGWFDETAPGATGWITSENMAEFMDEEGNLRVPTNAPVIGNDDETADPVPQTSVSSGAVPPVGSVRTRVAAELDGDDDGDENKWQRTA